MGQAVPEIPLSVGSKLELLLRASSLSLPIFRILPRTLTHLSAYRVIRVHDRGAEGLHFSAFIMSANIYFDRYRKSTA